MRPLIMLSKAYGDKINFSPGVDATEAFMLLPDPQTNGGLLIAVKPNEANNIIKLAQENGVQATRIGSFVAKSGKTINVI